MKTKRSVVFLVVLLLHVIVIGVLVWESNEISILGKRFVEPLVLINIPREASRPSTTTNNESPVKPLSKGSVKPSKEPRRNSQQDFIVAGPDEEKTEVPEVDWQNELEIAARNRAASDEGEASYRNLAKSLSQDQTNWLKRNNMESATTGIKWKSARIETMPDGMLIIHINDNCVLVPLFLIPMIFCRIGHAEPQGGMFDHMHDQ